MGVVLDASADVAIGPYLMSRSCPDEGAKDVGKRSGVVGEGVGEVVDGIADIVDV